MNIVIAGGSGFLGRALTHKLQEMGSQVSWLSSQEMYPDAPVKVFRYNQLDTLKDVDVVINLAGAGIADKPWSEKRKKIITDSRLHTTQVLVDWIQKQPQKPVFVSGSAIGWYGVQAGELTESSEPVVEFQHKLCDDWEGVANQLSNITRTIILRTGIVLDSSGGMLAKIKTPFSFGLGGNLGDGKQAFSWVSLDDWIRAVCYLLDNDTCAGAYNLTAPNPVTNAVFTKTFASHLQRPAFFHVPACVLKTLLGEMSTLLIDGQHVLPQRLTASGFTFKHNELDDFFESQ